MLLPKTTLKNYALWLIFCVVLGFLMAVLGTFFLTSLQWAAQTRRSYPLIIYFLPIAGFLMAYAYHTWGSDIEKGNKLIISQINKPSKVIHWLMAPFIFISTITSHIFGGSVGREGTAIQLGASIADQLALFFKSMENKRSLLLKCGVSAGFSAVFGTPLAALLFAFEFSKQKKIDFYAFVPVAISSFLAYYFAEILGAKHSVYSIGFVPEINLNLFLWTIFAGVIFGLCAFAFCFGMKCTQQLFEKIKYPPLRTSLGGLPFVGVVLFFGIENTEKFHGLGLEHISLSFYKQAPYYDFLVKMALTILVIAAGFKGGEVTPLFFIGATLGSAISAFVPLELGLLAGMGFIAVFSGAAKTPFSCIFMGLELFGYQGFVYFVPVCIIAYVVSGKKGIYH